MTTFEHIVVPTDFGEPAERALDFALGLASKLGSKLTLLYANWFPPLAYAAYAEGIYWPTDEMEKGARLELAKMLAKARERYPKTDGIVISGEPSHTILAVAKEQGADLIVMGTHGRHGLPRVLLGSVAEKIVRLSPIPVLTVSGRAEEKEAKELGAVSPEHVVSP